MGKINREEDYGFIELSMMMEKEIKLAEVMNTLRVYWN